MSISRRTAGAFQVVNAFKYGTGALPVAQGDLLVGDGSGVLRTLPLGTAVPPHSILSVGPPSAPPSARLQWASLTLSDAMGSPAAPIGAVSIVGATGAGFSELTVKRVEGGTGTAASAVSPSAGHVSLSADFALESSAGGVTTTSLVASTSAAGAPVVKTLEAGTNVTILDSGDKITLSSTAAPPPSPVPVTLASTGTVGAVSLVNDGTGPDLAIKGLTAGPGISVTNGVSDVTVGSSVALAPGAGAPAISLVAGSSVAGAPVVKSLVAGAGGNIILGTATDSVPISASIGSGFFPLVGAVSYYPSAATSVSGPGVTIRVNNGWNNLFWAGGAFLSSPPAVYNAITYQITAPAVPDTQLMNIQATPGATFLCHYNVTLTIGTLNLVASRCYDLSVSAPVAGSETCSACTSSSVATLCHSFVYKMPAGVSSATMAFDFGKSPSGGPRNVVVLSASFSAQLLFPG